MTKWNSNGDTINIDLERIRTFTDARAVITARVGPPSVIGHTIHDNLAEALFDRARLARRKRIREEMHAE